MTEEPTQKQESADDMQTILQIREVTLAGQKHTIKIRSIGDTYEFRRRVGELMSTLVKPLMDSYIGAGVETETLAENFDIEAVSAKLFPLLLGDGVDALIDMLWLYAPELKEFEADATDDEILDAALEVLEIAFPLVLKVGKRTVALFNRVATNMK